MTAAILITQNGLELPCVVLPNFRPLFPKGKEVIVYCQNRLVKAYMDSDEEYVAELEKLCDYCIIPELDSTLNDSIKDIDNKYSELKESIRHLFSKALMDGPIECNISVGTCESQGLSELELPKYTRIFEDSDIVWLQIDEYDFPLELDDLSLEEQLEIIKQLKDYV